MRVLRGASYSMQHVSSLSLLTPITLKVVCTTRILFSPSACNHGEEVKLLPDFQIAYINRCPSPSFGENHPVHVIEDALLLIT
jgi:hypothetical protein